MDEPNLSSGKPLTLHLVDGTIVYCRIERAIAPCTLSPVLTVRLDAAIGSLPEGLLVLKLYDRRFLTDLRTAKDVQPWSEKKEAAFQAYLLSGQPLPDPEVHFDREEAVLEGRFEAYLAQVAKLFHRCEVAAYAQLASLQGSLVPRFYAEVTAVDGLQEYGTTGILLEYINPSCTLSSLPHLPTPSLQPSDVAEICDASVQLIESVVHAHQLIHYDVRLQNVLVSTRKPYRVVLIDFASAVSRQEKAEWADEAAWNRAKAHVDEEGAIGYPLAMLISRWKGMEGAWRYTPSLRYKLMEWDEED
ncbi:hypothetical protein BT69DRAFT_1332537 [Atractiella rhizophila]|nr:hypothetical protein BT69DRAFT_1332537 [Atractiella rhizophila]